MSATAGMTWEQAVRSLIDDPARQDIVRASYFDPPLSGAAARFAAGEEWAEVRAFIGAPRGTAVDIGAGNGIVSYALAKDGWTTIAIEPDPSDLVGAGAIRALARDTGLSIDVRSGVGERLPLEDASVRVAVVRQVLHHASDLRAFCREIARVLAPGGVLVSLRDHVISGPEQLQAFLRIHPLHDLYGGENAFTQQEYREALTQAGLTIEREMRSFDSPVNYAPHTRQSLRREIADRVGLLGPAVAIALWPEPVMSLAMRVLTLVDRRPGRLISFFCRKLAMTRAS